jgi:hypothetical protein
MNVKQTLKELKAWLIENGYDGLFCAGECACSVDALAPCGETDFSECEPGYKVPCPESCGCHDWHISRNKPKEPLP